MVGSFMDRKIQLSILSMFVATALVGSIIVVSDNNMAFATQKKSNEALQDLSQSSSTGQSAGCDSENGTTLASCNNVALSFNLNDEKLIRSTINFPTFI